jgi:hypothetical protein
MRGLAAHQRRDHGRIDGVAADQPVRSNDPDIARARHRRHRRCGIGIVVVVAVFATVFVAVVRRVGIGTFVVRRFRSTQCVFCIATNRVAVFHQVEQALDLAGGEAGQVQVEARVREVREFQHEQRVVPPRVECDAVVVDDQRTLLRRVQVRQFDHRHVGHAEPACGEQPAVAGDHAVVAIDQDRRGPAEFHDARGDLRDLRVAVRSRYFSRRESAPRPGGSRR